MKIYIQFDFEGVAGFVVRDDLDRNIPTVLERTKRFQQIATQEVSVAVQGAFDGGADEVIVWDSHGDGNTLLVEELPEKTQLITGDYHRSPWLPFFDNIDVGMYIGGHAMTGTPKAVTPHTLMEVNKTSYGEVGIFILECASQDIPVVLVSGDSAVHKEVTPLNSGMNFVITKEAAGPTLAKTITPALSCKKIYEAAKSGVEKCDSVSRPKIKGPFTFSCNETDEFKSDEPDFLKAYRNYLEDCFNYNQGWPEYSLRDE